MKNFGLMMMVLSVFALGACQTLEGRGNKELMGGAGGAVIGGILGSKVGGGSGKGWATGVGVLLGALAGSEIGSSLDNADRLAAQQATYEAARHRIPWDTMKKLSNIIMNKKRQGQDITPALIIDLCQDHNILSPIAFAFEWAEPPAKEPEDQDTTPAPSDAPQEDSPITLQKDDDGHLFH